MKFSIKTISEKYLVGMNTKMSLAENKTRDLWRVLMPRRSEIRNRVDRLCYSMQIYNGLIDFSKFTPSTIFTKWAAFEVEKFTDVPEGMETHILSGGEYAVFIHKGTPATFPQTMRYIFGEWLPSSKYKLDDREHFEILEETNDRTDPNAEEEVWIPIRK